MSQPGNAPWVRLWRIEHPQDGIGPFNSLDLRGNRRPYISSYWGNDEGYEATWCPNPHRMPCPQMDMLVRPGRLPAYRWGEETPHLKFAYPSVRALRSWWCGRAIRDVAALGYVVAIVTVPWDWHTRYETQVRYDATKARLLETVSPVDLLWR